MKKNTTISTVFTSLVIAMTSANAAEIEVTINGSGTIKAIEAEQECNETCTIANELATNTLQASNDSFTGWTGQKCDAGNEIITAQAFERLSNVPGGAKTLSTADVNQDQLTDLAYISLFNGQIGVLTNQGGQEFTNVVIAENLNYPSAIAFSDWDYDGDNDLIAVEHNASKLKLYSNDGIGNFSFTKDISIPGYKPYAISVADINQDNSPDIAISSFSANTSGNLQTLVNSIGGAETNWFINNGQDDFELFQELSTTAAITTDVHLDTEKNTIELVTAEIESGDIAIYTMAIDSQEVNRSVVTTGTGAYGAVFGDIDNNGTIDVLSAHYRPSNLQISYRNNEGTFTSQQKYTNFPEGVTATAIVDIDNNSYKDIVTGEFNSNKFIFAKTTSYKDCIISTDNKIQITANFSNSQSTNNNTNSTTPNATAESSSGGGNLHYGYLLFTVLLIAMRQRMFSTNL